MLPIDIQNTSNVPSCFGFGNFFLRLCQVQNISAKIILFMSEQIEHYFIEDSTGNYGR